MTSPGDLAWLTDGSVGKALIIVVCLLLVAAVCYEKFGGVIDKLGITTKKSVERKAHEDAQEREIEDLRKALLESKSDSVNLDQLVETVSALSTSVTALQQSCDLISTDVKNIHTELDDIKAEQQDQKLKFASSRKAQYKETLYRAYGVYRRRYEETGKKEWTNVESDGFWTMFRDYECYDSNSFLHTEVEPFMRGFIVVNNY